MTVEIERLVDCLYMKPHEYLYPVYLIIYSFLENYIRSEMQFGAVSVRFGLILEAYCRGSQQHMLSLKKQMQCLEKLLSASKQCAMKQKKDRKAALQGFQDVIQEPHCQEAIADALNPLDPSFRWNRIK